ERMGAEAAWQDLTDLAEQTRDVSYAIKALSGPILLAFVDGHLEEALSLIEARMDRVQGTGLEGGGGGFVGAAGATLLLHARLLYYLGKPFEGPLARVAAGGRPQQSMKS